MFDRRQFSLESYRHYVYYWLSNLDLSFLFLRGDQGKIFSVEMFGTFSLGSLPFFLLGIKKAVEKISIHTFVLLSLLVSPLFFGLAGSVGYGHRLVAMIPAYVVVTTLGAGVLFEQSKMKKIVTRLTILVLASFFIVNTFNFMRYYFFTYPNLRETKEAFGNTLNDAFYRLSQISSKNNLTPYVQDDVYASHGDGIKFFEIAYFNAPLHLWKPGQTLPPRSLLLTQIGHIENLSAIDASVSPLYLLESR